ncbi:MAG: hypothetical protein ACI88Z_001393, partial [Sphingobacteriales bacterium]
MELVQIKKEKLVKEIWDVKELSELRPPSEP